MRGVSPFRLSKRRPEGGADPWAAFGYLVSGVGAYGLLGWGLSVWLHASWPIPVGILVGAALGLVLVYYQFVHGANAGTNASNAEHIDNNSTASAPDDEPPGESSDRGES